MRHYIFGMGSMGVKHLSILQDLRPNDEFFTYDSDPTLGSTDDHPRSDHIEGSCVYICTPTRWHQIHLDFIAQYHPRAVFVEKPLFSSGEARWCRTLSDIPYAIGFCYRFHPIFQKLKQEAEEGNIPHFHIYASDAIVRKYKEPALETLLSHPIATAQWLFGDFSEHTAIDDGECAYFSGKTHSGVDVSMSANMLSPTRISLVVATMLDREFRFHEQQVFSAWADDSMYVRQMKQWLSFVQGGDKGDLCDLSEALKIQSLLSSRVG